ncbi:hypothetical protein ACKWTF_014617 [Chironomus riparius]
MNGNASRPENENSTEVEDYSEEFPDFKKVVQKKVSRLCSQEGLYRRLPVLKWLPSYKTGYIIADFVAGLTVALTVIPQGIADAALAGLEPQYGLYAGFMGCFVYFFFGSTKDLTIGPTAILSILTFTIVAKLNADLAVFSTFISGSIILGLGILNLGFLMQFLSVPTITAFMNAATVTIASGQIRRLLGISSGKTNQFVDAWVNLFTYIEETRWQDTLLGVVSLVLLIAAKKWSMRNKKSLGIRYLSISRNAIIVFGGILIAYICHKFYSFQPFLITGEIASGFPSLSLPPLSTTNNGTYYNFSDMLSTLGLSTFSLPLISVIEAVAIAKSFNRGKSLDVTQEMIALGLCNIFSSFVRSIPITGSFTRSAVNNASGVKTQFGGIYTGAVVLLSLGLLTRTFEYIPKTSLAAVIIAAMFTMMNFGEVMTIWRTKKIDLVPFMGTFIISLLFGLDMGILVGAGIDILMSVYRTSRPHITYIVDDMFLIIKPRQNVIYSSAEYVKEKIIKKINENDHLKYVVIDGHNMCWTDLTTIKNFATVVDDCNLVERTVYFWNWVDEMRNGILRYDPKYKSVFKYSESLKELTEMLRQEDEKFITNL